MAYMVVSHEVESYEKWREVFLEHASLRKQMGCKGGKVFRTGESPCRVVLFLEWEDMERARKFTELPMASDGVKASGVIGTPDCWFFETMEVAIS